MEFSVFKKTAVTIIIICILFSGCNGSNTELKKSISESAIDIADSEITNSVFKEKEYETLVSQNSDVIEKSISENNYPYILPYDLSSSIPTKPNKRERVDESCLEMISNYDIPILRKEFVSVLPEWRQKNNLVRNRCFYFVIDDYIIISQYSGEIIGNNQTPCIIIDCGDKILEISESEIMYSSFPMYFIKDDVFFMYDYGMSSGFEHIYFVEFSLINGEKINEYLKVYSIGSNELDQYINTYSIINNIDDLQNYLYNISLKWYESVSENWDSFLL